MGRRPIFDHSLDVLGYKLVVASVESGDRGEQLVTDAAELPGDIEFDLHQYFGDSPVYVPVRPADIAANEHVPASDHAIVEVRASDCQGPEAMDLCRALVDSGGALCVDAGSMYELPEPMLEMVSTVKFDVGSESRDLLRRVVCDISDRGVTVVAKGVDSMHRVNIFSELGFEHFEGTLLCQPLTRVNEALTPTRLTCLKLIEVINDPGTSAKDIEYIVEREPGLGYRVLHVAGVGSSGGLRRTVDSISQAVVLLGRDAMYNWLILMLMSEASRGTHEQLTIAMTRARMCRLMASTVEPARVDAAYTVGLIAAMDLLLGVPLAQIVDNLAVTEEVAAAVMSHEGPLGEILADVLIWETAKFDSGELRSGVDLATVERHYLDALEWALQLSSRVVTRQTVST